MQKSLAIALLLNVCCACDDLDAATATGSFNVTVTIGATCQVNSATSLNFGMQSILSGNVDQTNTISITCTNTTPYNVGLDKGINGTSVTTRQMLGSLGGLINYSMFSDPARTQNWGNTVGADTLSATGTGLAQTFTIYGRIPPQPTPAADIYSDTIAVTVTY